MDSHSPDWVDLNEGALGSAGIQASRLRGVLDLATRTFLTAVPVLALIVCATWMVFTPGLLLFLQAALWTSSFVFLGLAIDTRKPLNGLSLASGVVLPVLADLSAQVAPEFAIAAAVIVAAWIGLAIWSRASE